MVSIQNIRTGDRDVLTGAWYWDLVCIVLACGYRVCLARWVYVDYLDDKVTVLILIIGAIRQIDVSLV